MILPEGHSILYQTIMDMLAENIQIELPAVSVSLSAVSRLIRWEGNYVANLINQTTSLSIGHAGTLIKESAQTALLKISRR